MKNKIQKFFRLHSVALSILSLFVLPTIVFAWGTLSLLSWDLVDSGKHMDYTDNTAYTITTGIAVWNTYKSGVIRVDAWNTINDVTYSDVDNLGTDIVGQTSSNGTIKFARDYMDYLTSTQRKNVVIHETGHALRLGHRDEDDSVMLPYVTTITTLSQGDKNNYDYAYDYYY